MTVQNGSNVETTNAVETPVTTTVVKPRAASVSGVDFRKFMYSDEAKNMTISEAAVALGMSVTTFSQRLNSLRKDRKVLIEKLKEAGREADIAKVPEIPSLKDGRTGRKGQKQEFNENQRALLAFLG